MNCDGALLYCSKERSMDFRHFHFGNVTINVTLLYECYFLERHKIHIFIIVYMSSLVCIAVESSEVCLTLLCIHGRFKLISFTSSQFFKNMLSDSL